MKKALFRFSSASVFCFFCVPLARSDGRRVLKKMIESQGGAEFLRSVKDLQSRGRSTSFSRDSTAL